MFFTKNVYNIATVFVNFPLSKLYWSTMSMKKTIFKGFSFCQSQRTDFKDNWDLSLQWILKDDGNNWFDVIFIWIDNFHRTFVFDRTGGQIGTRAFQQFFKGDGNNWFKVTFIRIDNFHRFLILVAELRAKLSYCDSLCSSCGTFI